MTGDVRLLHGDALDVLRSDTLGYPHALGYHPPRIPDASVDAIVTDPPYGLAEHHPRTVAAALAAWLAGDREHVPDGRGFMGREWDRFVPPPAVWDECLRVLKPGGALLAFAGSRTADLMGMSIRLAGFEIRDGIAWHYGSGFPKSLDVSKAIDKAAGARREAIGEHHRHGGGPAVSGSMAGPLGTASALPLTAPATEDARRWQGWGTALKPATEPIVVARKPLAGTVAATVLAYGTGALNIDACRVDGGPIRSTTAGTRRSGGIMGESKPLGGWAPTHTGRWPSNVVLSHPPLLDDAGDVAGDACAGGCVPGCPVAELDAQSGQSKSPTGMVAGQRRRAGIMGEPDGRKMSESGYGDAGGASRFFPVFRYQAKAPTRERPKVNGVAHPTVKPLGLMRWLVRLVTPPGGTVLDLFAGSGTTGEACAVEGFPCLLIEREADYLPHIGVRLDRQRHAQPALL